MSDQATCRIRTYRRGDEEELVRLFNDAHKDYAGFTLRTPEFWLWLCRNRPGVHEEGIFIAETDDEVLGYAVVSDFGDVLEFCYKANQTGEENVLKLLEAIEGYVKNAGAGSITLNAPADDPIIRSACSRLGYAESSPSYALQLSVVDLPGFIREILLSKLKKMRTHSGEEILLKIGQPSTTDYDYIALRIRNNDLWVERKRTENPDFTIQTDKGTLISYISRNSSFVRGILTGKIKVSPFWKLSRALTLFSLLELDAPWYFPLGDYG